MLSSPYKIRSCKNYYQWSDKTSDCESDFYNWNRVKIRYCDGGSFAGNAEFDNGVTFSLHFSFS